MQEESVNFVVSPSVTKLPNFTYEFTNYSQVLFNFEEKFSHSDTITWMLQNWTSGFWYCGIYVIIIFGGQRLMQNRPRFVLRKALIVWNTLLATFSIIGACRTVPEMIHTLSNYGLYHSVCVPSFILDDKVVGFWTWMFALSKVPELGDTVFIILRKQPLIFLHWYHHITVLLYTWYAYKEYTSSARWFVCMNYCVHSLMYTYYALRAMGKRPPRITAMMVTSLQIIQMIIGALVNVWSYQYLTAGQPCHISQQNINLSLMMYVSYFALFLRFFIKAYVSSESRKEKKV